MSFNASRILNCCLLLICIVKLVAASSSFDCLNGGKYDAVYHRCDCKPFHYGDLCATSFADSDPCQMADKLPVIDDPFGAHRPGSGNGEDCYGTDGSSRKSCFDFASIEAGWYRVQSPWGDRLVEGCDSEVADADCGGRAAYVLHDITREASNHRALFSAKAFRVARAKTPVGKCRLAEGTFYPVRLLRCTDQLTLYFLQRLPERHSFCIGGEKARRGSRLRSKAAKVPSLELYYEKRTIESAGRNRDWSTFNSWFICTVFGAEEGEELASYSVKFILTDRDGKGKVIESCGNANHIIPASGSAKFRCPWIEFVKPKSNVHGSTLVCVARAENKKGHDLVSNIHSFLFRHKFLNVTNVIRPDQPVSLCIDSRDIPVREKVTFSVSIARQLVIPRDPMDIAVLQSDLNGTQACEFAISNTHERRHVCMRLILYNQDPEGRHVFGLSDWEQISKVNIKIFYSSDSDGLYTYGPDGEAENRWELSETVDLQVDLSTQSTGPQRYLHIFSDPYVKPVHESYSPDSVYELKVEKGREVGYTAMRHRLLPYEVQVLLARPELGGDLPDSTVTTRVAIRYGYNVITVYGSANFNSGALTYTTECKMPGKGNTGAAFHCDTIRKGVDIESTGEAVRIKFLFYGTIIYVWKFRTMHKRDCVHSFVMSQQEMNTMKCGGSTHLFGVNGDAILDVVIVPGMLDTKGNIAGLMYMRNRSNVGSAEIRGESRSLFSASYEMQEITDSQGKFIGLYQPPEAIKICSCNSKKQGPKCFASLYEVERSRRDAASREPTGPGSKVAELKVARPKETSATAKLNITSTEAKQFCVEFLGVRMADLNYSISICTGHSGVDYARQFEFLCVQYALTLASFEFTETLLDNMLGMCLSENEYNATLLRNDSRILTDMAQELCPNNCSGSGTCLSGVCVCTSGYTGRGCENRTDQLEHLPTLISMPQQSVQCSAHNCSSTLLMVSPLLKSTVAVCQIRELQAVSGPYQWLIPAVYASGNLMLCNLSDVHAWLREKERLFVMVEMTLFTEEWSSSNSIRRLVHQSSCLGKPIECFSLEEQIWACTVRGEQQFGNSSDVAASGNVCLLGKNKVASLKHVAFILLLVVLMIILSFTCIRCFCYDAPRRHNDALLCHPCQIGRGMISVRSLLLIKKIFKPRRGLRVANDLLLETRWQTSPGCRGKIIGTRV